jgi:hypothetical protein
MLPGEFATDFAQTLKAFGLAAVVAGALMALRLGFLFVKSVRKYGWRGERFVDPTTRGNGGPWGSA